MGFTVDSVFKIENASIIVLRPGIVITKIKI